MLKAFTPDYYFPSLKEIDPQKLKEKGISLLFIDFDNTLVESKSEIPSETSITFIKKCHDNGILPVILSNNFAGRSGRFAKEFDCKLYPFSLKPLRKGYQQAMRDHHVKKEECACIGDQLLTDIWGASRMKIMSILVDPVSEKDNFFGAINRIPEKMIYYFLEKNNILKKGQYYGSL